MPVTNEVSGVRHLRIIFLNKAKIRKYFIPSYPLACKGKDKFEDEIAASPLAPRNDNKGCAD